MPDSFRAACAAMIEELAAKIALLRPPAETNYNAFWRGREELVEQARGVAEWVKTTKME